MNNPELLKFLNTFPKIRLIEAYTNRSLGYITTPWTECNVINIAEVRLRANEMPEVYYETKRSLKHIEDSTRIQPIMKFAGVENESSNNQN